MRACVVVACMHGASHVPRDAYVHRRMDLLNWTKRTETNRNRVHVRRDFRMVSFDDGSSIDHQRRWKWKWDRKKRTTLYDRLIRLHLLKSTFLTSIFVLIKSDKKRENKGASRSHVR